jgi:16S rRNA (uracil1498-N3)-methyltransferase
VSRHRFHIPRGPSGPPSGSSGASVEIAGAEAHHLLHVLRLGVGDPVQLFDGRGSVAEGAVRRVSRATATVEAGPWRRDDSAEPAGLLTVIAAPPKGKRLDMLLEKATELGMTRFVPLRCERGVRTTGSDGPGEGWARTCLEAARQCGRNTLPEIAPEVEIAALCGPAFRPSPDTARWFCRPGSPSVWEWFERTRPAGPVAAVTFVVGPEGGLTDAEEAALTAAGWQAVSLSRAILRIETAALAALALAGQVVGRR